MKPAWLLLLILTLAASAWAGQVAVGRFSAGDLAGWERETFSGRTDYELVQDHGRTVLKAHTKGGATGLFKQISIDLRKRPILRWSWKVAGVIKGGDARRKSGDDYCARVYVVWPSFFIWRTKSISYIWANKLPQGTWVANPFSSNVKMVAVRSGPDQAGKWFSEERDVLADYQRLFGEDPGPVGAVAVMTDADNTGGEATAWYGDISFSAK